MTVFFSKGNVTSMSRGFLKYTTKHCTFWKHVYRYRSTTLTAESITRENSGKLTTLCCCFPH